MTAYTALCVATHNGWTVDVIAHILGFMDFDASADLDAGIDAKSKSNSNYKSKFNIKSNVGGDN